MILSMVKIILRAIEDSDSDSDGPPSKKPPSGPPTTPFRLAEFFSRCLESAVAWSRCIDMTRRLPRSSVVICHNYFIFLQGKKKGMEDHEPARQRDLTSGSLVEGAGSTVPNWKCRHRKGCSKFCGSDDEFGMGRSLLKLGASSRCILGNFSGRASRNLSPFCLLFFVSLFLDPVSGQSTSTFSQRSSEISDQFWIPSRNARRVLQQQSPYVPGLGVREDNTCMREAVPSESNPALWLYAADQAGILQHGLTTPTLVTDGYPGTDAIVGEWKGMLSNCCVCYALW
jgi:hypothetical protein